MMASYLLWQLQATFFTLLVSGVGVAIALWSESSLKWRPSLKSAHFLNAGLVSLCVAVLAVLPFFSYDGSQGFKRAGFAAPWYSALSLPAPEAKGADSPARPTIFVLPVSANSPLHAPSVRFLCALFLAATFVRWLGALRELRTLKRLLNRATLLKSRGAVRVWVGDDVAGPFAFAGLRRSHVVLPASMLEASDSLKWARRHEFQHIRQGDVQRAYLWACLKVLVPLAPWLSVWERSLGSLEEYLCDEASSANMAERRHYARWLVDSSAKYSAAVSGGALGRGIFNPEKVLRRRVHMLAHTKRGSMISVRILGVATLSLAAAGVWAAQRLEWRGGMSEAEARAFIAKAGEKVFAIPATPKILEAVRNMHGHPGRRERYEQALARMKEFRPQIEEMRKKYGIPEELLAVGIVESGYQNLTADKNPVKAAGIWQFIPASARSFGLRVDNGVDERLDVLKETDAAFRYLAGSYLEFQDWPLAVLSFNMGRGAVSAGIAKHGTRDAWALVEKGIENDRDYLPKFAAAVVGM